MTKEELKYNLLAELKIIKDKKGFLNAGLPRFNRLFGRDSLISAWQFLNYDSNIAKHTLEILSDYQGKVSNRINEEEPGKILHEVKGHFPWDYYGSVDSTPLFLILFYFYFKKTKDIEFIKKHWPNILLALNWIINYGDIDNDLFLEYEKKSKKGLFHQAWKDSFQDSLNIKPPVVMVEVQGYQYLALKRTGELAKEIFNDIKLYNSLIKRSEKLKEKFNKEFWMEKEKYFALAMDKNKEQKKAITSNPGHLLFTGIVEKEKINLVVKRLFQKDMWTAYGVRTLSVKDADFKERSYHFGSVWPHDNWIIAQGLKSLGYKKEYEKIKKALLKAYKKIGFIPELYYIVDKDLIQNKKACHPQAWSLGALFSIQEISSY
jgi:glycogen debranching enzyme